MLVSVFFCQTTHWAEKYWGHFLPPPPRAFMFGWNPGHLRVNCDKLGSWEGCPRPLPTVFYCRKMQYWGQYLRVTITEHNTWTMMYRNYGIIVQVLCSVLVFFYSIHTFILPLKSLTITSQERDISSLRFFGSFCSIILSNTSRTLSN